VKTGLAEEIARKEKAISEKDQAIQKLQEENQVLKQT